MESIAFNPATTTIADGDIVRWTNNEDIEPHTVTSGRAGDADAGQLFDSGNITPGETYCLQFNAPGDYQYYCEIHPTQMNDGLITVE